MKREWSVRVRELRDSMGNTHISWARRLLVNLGTPTDLLYGRAASRSLQRHNTPIIVKND